jgi:hypothetical protein
LILDDELWKLGVLLIGDDELWIGDDELWIGDDE